MSDALWRLPGPMRFANQMRRSLERGYSPVVSLPRQQLGDQRWQDQLLYSVDWHVNSIDTATEAERPAASLVADALGISDLEPGPDAAAELARHQGVLGRTLQLVLPDESSASQWCGFARRFITASRSTAVVDRPRLLILTGHQLTGALTQKETLLQPLWWWGVTDRLDTAVHVADKLFDARADVVLRDSIVEVAGYDLALADHLADTWNGAISTLDQQLSDYRVYGNEVALELPELPHSSTPHDSPPVAMTQLWDHGLADAWDAFPAYLHPCFLVGIGRSQDVYSRVWRAQLRALMPMIDEERGRLGSWMQQELSPPHELPDPAEPGDLFHALQLEPSLKSWRGGHRKRLIYWLRDTRNTLAHLGTLTPEELKRGRQLIAADRTQS